MAEPVLWGSKVLLNGTGTKTPFDPEILGLNDGTFVAVWTDNTGSGKDIRGQIFNADGAKKGGEFLVHNALAGNQQEPTIALLSDGRFVVVWRNHNSSSADEEDIKAQIFKADGTKDGNEITVNIQSNPGRQTSPSVAALSNGGFVVSFTDERTNIDGSGSAVKAQAYDAYGNPFGHEVQVNKTTMYDQYGSFVLGLGNSYVAFFDDNSQSPDKPEISTIRGRIFSMEGLERRGEFVLPVTRNEQSHANAVVLQDGRYAVTWAAYNGDGNGVGIRGQIFNPDGTRFNGEFQVNAVTSGTQTFATAVTLQDGGFAIAYKTILTSTSNEYHLATFNADGTRLTSNDLRIAIAQGDQFDLGTQPKMSALADGRIIIAWSDSIGSSGNVYAQILDPRGQAVVLNGTNAADQYIGTAYHDRLNGASGNDALRGEAGNDVIDGGEGQDSMDGGAGDDTYYVENSGDGIVDTSGLDTVISSVSYALPTFIENLTASGIGAVTLTGNAFNNTLMGNAAANILNGGTGSDIMQGGDGNDTYFVDVAGDRVAESASGGTADQVVTSVSYTLAAYVEHLTASGASSINLMGNSLANVITGNGAANRINGGAGNDVLSGGAGKDIFVFDTKPHAKSNKDLIKDWSYKDDTIRLENAIFKALKKTGTLKKDFFTLGAKAKDGNDHVGYNKANGDLWWDFNGNKAGGQVVFANIGTNKAIFHSDFAVI